MTIALAPASYAPAPAPTVAQVIAYGRGRPVGCTCSALPAATTAGELLAQVEAYVAARRFTLAQRLLNPLTPDRLVCSCPPRTATRAARPRQPRAPLVRRPPVRELNACNTAWPGGFQFVPFGAPLPTGWVRTQILDGFATNPRCYPPAASGLLDSANDGSFANARRAQTLAHVSPDQSAQRIQACVRGYERGTRSPASAGACVASLMNLPLNPRQVGDLRAAQLAAGVVARGAEAASRVLPADALTLREVEATCGRPRGEQWACFSHWPGGWLPFAHAAVTGNPAWIGPTPYGTLIEGCYGFRPGFFARLGRWATEVAATVAPALVVAPSTNQAPPVAGQPAPAPAPPERPPRPAGIPLLRCQQLNLYGQPYGEVLTGYLDEPAIAAVNGVYPWACSTIGVSS